MFLTANPPSENCQKEQRATDLQILRFSLQLRELRIHVLSFFNPFFSIFLASQTNRESSPPSVFEI
uniref:Uncharacterized protein n=1 Tax=Cucumis melo TaxID=3656 RepID=A0A9I9E8J1_CUCME